MNNKREAILLSTLLAVGLLATACKNKKEVESTPPSNSQVIAESDNDTPISWMEESFIGQRLDKHADPDKDQLLRKRTNLIQPINCDGDADPICGMHDDSPNPTKAVEMLIYLDRLPRRPPYQFVIYNWKSGPKSYKLAVRDGFGACYDLMYTPADGSITPHMSHSSTCTPSHARWIGDPRLAAASGSPNVKEDLRRFFEDSTRVRYNKHVCYRSVSLLPNFNGKIGDLPIDSSNVAWTVPCTSGLQRAFSRNDPNFASASWPPGSKKGASHNLPRPALSEHRFSPSMPSVHGSGNDREETGVERNMSSWLQKRRNQRYTKIGAPLLVIFAVVWYSRRSKSKKAKYTA